VKTRPARHSSRRLVLALSLAGLLTVVPGCAGLGYLFDVVIGDRVPAKYDLSPKQSTLIIVDDPQNELTEAGLRGRIGTTIAFHLKQNTAITEKQLVSWRKFREVRRKLGDDYPTTPIATVGQRTGARQVIHVLVQSVNYQLAGSIYRPTAFTETKVIDAQNGDMRFPVGGEVEGLGDPRGFRMRTQLPPRRADPSERGGITQLSRKLTRQIGLEVARLFYNHKKKPEGQSLTPEG